VTFAFFYIVAIQLVLPAIFIFSLLKGTFQSKLEWVIQFLATALLTIWLFFAGSWDWIGYFIRFVWFILLIFAGYRSWKKTRNLPFRTHLSGKQKLSMGLYAVIFLVFALYNVFVISSYTVGDEAIELSFPLKDGSYYVGQGGNHVQMNYHNAYPSQKYALDIVKLNIFGTRASGVYPKELEKYEIYGSELYSPCDGNVVEARDHLPDLIPPDADPENPEGNYVALSCEGEDAVIFIAHMKKGSVAVDEGTIVEEGQRIGLVGNSGNTTEPHLHIHAEKEGKGVPLRFNGRFLVRNHLVVH